MIQADEVILLISFRAWSHVMDILPTEKGVPMQQMIAGKNMRPRGTYQIFGLEEDATPTKTLDIKTPPKA
jgi:hypothetical protein